MREASLRMGNSMALQQGHDSDLPGPPEGRDSPGTVQASAVAEEVPSNFISGTQIQWAWDATSISAFLRCPRYYKLSIVDGWGGGDNIHLRWGNELHRSLEDYDRAKTTGRSHDDAVHDTIRALLSRIHEWDPSPRTKAEELKTKSNLLRSVVWYLEHYNPDPAETVILANGSPAVELNFNFGLEFGPKAVEGIPYSLCGYLDRVVEFNGDRFVMDRKSTSTTPGSYYFERFDLDVQMTTYTLAGQVILQSPIRGVIIDAIQVAVGFTRPVRGITYRTPDQLDEWLNQLRVWLSLAETFATADFWPMNLTSCDKYGGCQFAGICSKSPSVRERFLAGQTQRSERWNPLKPR
jgi:hypothetical protein